MTCPTSLKHDLYTHTRTHKSTRLALFWKVARKLENHSFLFGMFNGFRFPSFSGVILWTIARMAFSVSIFCESRQKQHLYNRNRPARQTPFILLWFACLVLNRYKLHLDLLMRIAQRCETFGRRLGVLEENQTGSTSRAPGSPTSRFTAQLKVPKRTTSGEERF